MLLLQLDWGPRFEPTWCTSYCDDQVLRDLLCQCPGLSSVTETGRCFPESGRYGEPVWFHGSAMGHHLADRLALNSPESKWELWFSIASAENKGENRFPMHMLEPQQVLRERRNQRQGCQSHMKLLSSQNHYERGPVTRCQQLANASDSRSQVRSIPPVPLYCTVPATWPQCGHSTDKSQPWRGRH